ncbi:MAG: methylated-DNA-protein-cysteine methyltransferase related protein [Microgenomates group bacterium Gr01-1014_5]|nr:MAG: methylated-DNA-protein-cysteine methyltransferase related protein [Microgenomates group bacterium Gr01-1014_5]
MQKAKVQVKSENYITKVHNFVCKIPKGKVMTYGALAREIKIQNSKVKIDARMVGWALHQNKSDKVPCHRVVNKEGRVASGFAFGGPVEQKRRLEAEGVVFKSDLEVDLEKCFADLP